MEFTGRKSYEGYIFISQENKDDKKPVISSILFWAGEKQVYWNRMLIDPRCQNVCQSNNFCLKQFLGVNSFFEWDDIHLILILHFAHEVASLETNRASHRLKSVKFVFS